MIFHFNFNQSYFLSKALKTVFDCKTVATVHFIKWMLELQGNLTRWKSIKSKPENQRTHYEQFLFATDEYEGRLYKEVDRVIALSLYTQHHLCNEYKLHPDKISVIPNGLEDVQPLLDTDKADLRRKRNISEKEYVILFAGRLQAVKGLMFLLKAFREVLQIIPTCRLLIAGGGNNEAYLREALTISDKISFTGFLEKNDLYELYRIADIGVMPSLNEQCSYVSIEMMRHGLPITVSTTTGLKEMIVDGETGFHIPVIESVDKAEIDTALLAEKIIFLLKNPSEAKRLGENARKHYETKYSSKLFRKNMIDFYQSLYD